MYFQHGWIKARSPPLLLRNTTAQVEVYRGLDSEHVLLSPLPKERWSWSYLREAEHFIEAVAEVKDFRSPGEDALVDTKVVEEIFRLWLR